MQNEKLFIFTVENDEITWDVYVLCEDWRAASYAVERLETPEGNAVVKIAVAKGAAYRSWVSIPTETEEPA